MAGRRKQEQNKYKIISTLIIIAVVIFVIVSRNADVEFNPVTKSAVNPNSEGMLFVHYIDVGQGDCEFIELPDGRCVLIDAGESAYSSVVSKEIKELGYDKIDFVVGTHPHTDHIGGLRGVVSSFDIGAVYMPRASSNSATFEKLLLEIKDKGLKINTVKAGDKLVETDEYSMVFLAPLSDSYEDLNNYSAVIRLEYNGNTFLFTGDAESLSENEMLDYYYDELDCDVLKVGHHGSRYSTSDEFLDAVSPSYAIISCGKGNSYGHPHQETLSKLYDVNTQVLRTDQLGSITICCDADGGFEVAYDLDS